ncbi:MAG: LPP20 family lipoprotein [Flavobacteriales bacterium]|nr:LPP20 family lipoprotein [Flavobacteriales bacterium]
MIRVPLLIVLLGLVACKGGKEIQESQASAPPQAPGWVTQRPVSSSYYIGIGTAPKVRDDHQTAAKKNALNDLASEISVQVEGNSLLYTLDDRRSFDETFTSTIRTRTSEQLEGFELVDSWDDGRQFWTYYRLSKAEHARIKAERKRRAVASAMDLHARSGEAMGRKDLRSAVDLQLRALLAMTEYWGEADQVEMDGRSVDLSNELYAGLLDLFSTISISSLPDRCVLEFKNGFQRELLLKVRRTDPVGPRDLGQVPLRVEYPGANGPVKGTRVTDSDGMARTMVQEVALEARTRELNVRLEPMDLVNPELDQALIRPLIAGVSVPGLVVPIELRPPAVHLVADEQLFGSPLTSGGTALVLRESLSGLGFRFVGPGDAEALLYLEGRTREGGSSNGFHTAYLDLALTYRDARTKEVLYQGGKQNVKGVQLDMERAARDAYKRAGQDVQRELVPALLNAIF